MHQINLWRLYLSSHPSPRNCPSLPQRGKAPAFRNLVVSGSSPPRGKICIVWNATSAATSNHKERIFWSFIQAASLPFKRMTIYSSLISHLRIRKIWRVVRVKVYGEHYLLSRMLLRKRRIMIRISLLLITFRVNWSKKVRN